MTKYEFLYALRETLENVLTPSQVEEQVQYYANYIDEQMRMGYSETQILAELGDARSIAHNIIDGIEADRQNDRHSNGEQTYETYSEDGSENYSSGSSDTTEKLKSYAKLAVILLIVFVVLIALTRLIILALPTILTVAVIMWIIKKINGQ